MTHPDLEEKVKEPLLGSLGLDLASHGHLGGGGVPVQLSLQVLLHQRLSTSESVKLLKEYMPAAPLSHLHNQLFPPLYHFHSPLSPAYLI